MRFNLEELNPAVFFPFENESDGGVSVRLPSAEDMERIAKATTKKRVEYKKGQRFEFVEVDDTLKSEMLWDHIITGWTTYDTQGNTIPCTKENKVKLMKQSLAFAGFVGECLDKLGEMKTRRDEELEKN